MKTVLFCGGLGTRIRDVSETWQNIGERLWAVRGHVAGEEMFYANCSDGLCDVDLTDMTAAFRGSGKIACLIALRPSFSLRLLPMDTLKDKQVVEDLVEKDVMPWRLKVASRLSVNGAQRKIQ